MSGNLWLSGLSPRGGGGCGGGGRDCSEMSLRLLSLCFAPAIDSEVAAGKVASAPRGSGALRGDVAGNLWISRLSPRGGGGCGGGGRDCSEMSLRLWNLCFAPAIDSDAAAGKVASAPRGSGALRGDAAGNIGTSGNLWLSGLPRGEVADAGAAVGIVVRCR